MELRRYVVLVAVLPLAMFASGCSNSTSTTAPTGATPSDQSDVVATLSSAGALTDDGLAEDNTHVSAATALARPAGGESAEPLSAQAAIRPFTWWQSVTGETRTWTFAFSDTDSTAHPRTCIATLVKHMTGVLVVVPESPADSTKPDTALTVRKPLDKTLTRRIMLSRLLINQRYLWKVVQVTGGFVSTPAAQTSILSLHLHSASGVDTTLTSPLQWFALRHVIKFGTSDSVTVTVTTSRTNDVVYIHRWDWRHRLHNNLDGTYSFTWVTSPWSGWRYFGIQAMSHGSLYSDTLPFDMQAWHFPFRVVGGQADVAYYP